MGLPKELELLRGFHGHLGPYVTIGLRMGKVARRELGDYRGLKVTVTTPLRPPVRCVVDGIQFSSGCTFGKGNIKLQKGPRPVAVFTKNGLRLTIALRSNVMEKVDSEMSKKDETGQSLRYYRMTLADLFEISRD